MGGFFSHPTAHPRDGKRKRAPGARKRVLGFDEKFPIDQPTSSEDPPLSEEDAIEARTGLSAQERRLVQIHRELDGDLPVSGRASWKKAREYFAVEYLREAGGEYLRSPAIGPDGKPIPGKKGEVVDLSLREHVYQAIVRLIVFKPDHPRHDVYCQLAVRLMVGDMEQGKKGDADTAGSGQGLAGQPDLSPEEMGARFAKAMQIANEIMESSKQPRHIEAIEVSGQEKKPATALPGAGVATLDGVAVSASTTAGQSSVAIQGAALPPPARSPVAVGNVPVRR